MPRRKTRVAILGGGVSSVVTAYQLTRTPELRSKYDVTVYQLGWRLGGKGASGRNAELGERIEEHGLHLWMGFYENAFSVMRECYEELNRDPSMPLATWRDAFKPCDDVVLYDLHRNRWRGFGFHVPRNALTPGDGTPLPGLPEIAHTTTTWLWREWKLLASTRPFLAETQLPMLPVPAVVRHVVEEADRITLHVASRVWDVLVGHPERWLEGSLRLAEHAVENAAGEVTEHLPLAEIAEQLVNFKQWLWNHAVSSHLEDDHLRVYFTVLDVVATAASGLCANGLVEQGFDVINDEEMRDWLRRHGALPITLSESPLLRGIYDMAFAYENGDKNRPTMAAGTCVHDCLRLFFTYRGAVFWKMQAGMGDTVFTPFYRVLQQRGVRFKFFHAVSHLGLSPNRDHVDAIEVVEQVPLANQDQGAEYQPLRTVRDLECWPSAPLWDQLEDGTALAGSGVNFEYQYNPLGRAPKVLRRGGRGADDFDIAVLGISVAALPEICTELVADAGNPGFKEMLDHSSTVMTQAFQLWLNRPLQRMGWEFPENSAMTCYVEPMDTYCNMAHLLPREDWAPGDRVEDIAYFCGVLKDEAGDTQESCDKRAHADALAFLQRDIGRMWPLSTRHGARSFDWQHLADRDRRAGAPRFDSQYWHANYQASERYVITPPGSVKHRLRAGESGYENLVLTGDWIRTGLDAGCVEAAVMAGMQASRAICGQPQHVFGEDHGWIKGRRR